MGDTQASAVELDRNPGEPVLVAGGIERARWEVDTSEARPLLERMRDGQAPSPYWVEAVLADTRVAEVSAQVEQRVGSYFGQEQMLGRPVGTFWPPESRSDFAEMILEVFAHPLPEASLTRTVSSLLLRDAQLTVWRTQAQAPDRLFVRIEGVARDGRSNWALRASEDRYRKLIHHLPFALVQIDGRAMSAVYDRMHAEGVQDVSAHLDAHPELIAFARENVRITEVNRSAALLLGAGDGTALIGPVARLFAASPDTPRRIMTSRFAGNRNHIETTKLRTLDGRLLDVRLSITFPAPPEQADVTLISLEDLTDHLQTEAQLRQIQADFSRAARIATLGELTSSIAHEVNQPLSAIITNAETSLRWLGRDDPNLEKIAQLTSRIVASAGRASEIVQRIRSMVARHVPERTLLDLNEVIHEALMFVRHDLETRAIGIELDLHPRLCRILGDRVQLQQVVVNLLLNAIQAISQATVAGGWIDVATTNARDDHISFVIRDSGPGIDAENLERVFDGFFTTKEEGMGIGLAICQSIIAAHGGTIEVANHPDGGAMFSVSLPAATPA